jgi:AcrR family transcriptional regulator
VNRKPPGRAKGRRTRARLMDSAERVFIEKGYLAARVADIAHAADLAHGSFYTYFDSKEDVFRQVADRVVQDVYSALEAGVGGGSPLERIQASNRRYLELYERHADMLALIEQVATFDESFRAMRLELRRRFVARIERAVRRIQSQGDAAVEPMDPRMVANALGGMVDNFSFAFFVLGEPFDRTEALETLDEIWRRTLGLSRVVSAPPGRDHEPGNGDIAARRLTEPIAGSAVLPATATMEGTA